MDLSLSKKEENDINIENTPTPNSNNKECWICMAKGSEPLIRPCKCKGSTKYVHYSCFKSFVANKSIKNKTCTFCKYKYIVKYENALFIKIYEFMQKLNQVASTIFFILLFVVICYVVMFIYGFSVIVLFVGYEEMIKHMKYASAKFMIGKVGLMLKISYSLPCIPFVLIVSTHKQFKMSFHVVSGLLLIDTFKFKWLFFYSLPILLYIYKSNMYRLQKKLGKTESIVSGVIVNEHQFDVRSLSDILTSPFIGALFSNLINIKDRVWRCFVGISVYMVVKDITCVYFLICDKRRFNTMTVEEYEEKED